jgi:hypothetical protein
MHNFYTSSLTVIATITLLTGCASGGGYNNYGLAGAQGNQYPSGAAATTNVATGANPQATALGASILGASGNTLAAAAALNAAAANPSLALEDALLNTLTQNIAGSVINGQIGSQIAPADQSFRLQQLGGSVQSGTVNQPQQWVNPQTGSSIALNPVGQNSINPQTQQQCHTLQEAVTLQNGQNITENRVACLDPQTGKWTLAQ